MRVIETRRLRLRPFELADAEVAHAWFGDPAVMRYTPTGVDGSVQQTRDRLVGYQTHQTTHGFSKWLVMDRLSGEPIGDAGLLDLPEEGWPQGGWIDLGFRLLPSQWGKGLATEAARAWVDTAFGVLNLQRLGAFAHPRNAASIRVLENVGFRARGQDTVRGMPAIIFGLDAAAVRKTEPGRQGPVAG